MTHHLPSASCPSGSVMSGSLPPHGLQPARPFCPWNSPGKNTGVHSLLQVIFPTQGSNLDLLHYRQILCHLSHQGNPIFPSHFRISCEEKSQFLAGDPRHKNLLIGYMEKISLKPSYREKMERMPFLNAPLVFSTGPIWSPKALTLQAFSSHH